MPRMCSVCNHTEIAAINQALLGGESTRAVAMRFNLSASAISRHALHNRHKKTRMSTSHLSRIDEQIARLTREQDSAKRKRDTVSALAIARELRNWLGLRSKAEAITTAVQSVDTDGATMTRSEALAVATALIESEVTAGSTEIVAWMRGLLERVDHTDVRTAGKLPDTQSEVAENE